MVRVYGHSDDLVEIISTDSKDIEIDSFGRDVRVTFTDGTVIRVSFTHGWNIKVTRKGTALFNLKSCESLKTLDPDAYSDIFEIDAEVSTYRKL